VNIRSLEIRPITCDCLSRNFIAPRIRDPRRVSFLLFARRNARKDLSVPDFSPMIGAAFHEPSSRAFAHLRVLFTYRRPSVVGHTHARVAYAYTISRQFSFSSLLRRLSHYVMHNEATNRARYAQSATPQFRRLLANRRNEGKASRRKNEGKRNLRRASTRLAISRRVKS